MCRETLSKRGMETSKLHRYCSQSVSQIYLLILFWPHDVVYIELKEIKLSYHLTSCHLMISRWPRMYLVVLTWSKKSFCTQISVDQKRCRKIMKNIIKTSKGDVFKQIYHFGSSSKIQRRRKMTMPRKRKSLSNRSDRPCTKMSSLRTLRLTER